MNENTEQSTWERQWQSKSPDSGRQDFASQLARRVARQSRRQLVGLIFPVLVTVLIGGGLILEALRDPQPVAVALAAEGWVFILAVWASAIWLARGTWRPLGETTQDFLDLSVRRCRANIRGIGAAIAFYVGQFLVVFALLAAYTDAPVIEILTSWRIVVLGGIVFPLMLIGGIWFIGRQREELGRLEQMQEQLSENGGT